jgi:perosamine synthetase
MSSPLALFGGPKTITKPFTPYRTIGDEEIAAVTEVLKGGVLSQFIGAWNPDFYGGPQILAFEKEWAERFNVKHAITMNSNTSGLIAALGAVGVEPGDEVIVTPWTMAASATAIVVWGAIPVFADIEAETFNLDPRSVEKLITPRTKAIMAVDIFGHAADLDGLMAIAKKHNIKLIEDAAQAPGALYKGKHVGTVGDIGVFSLNYHKHIHTGEGGVCVTNDPVLAERLQLIRNHGEVVVRDKPGVTDISNIIGYNFRMTEIEAAIGRQQLKKLDGAIKQRMEAASELTSSLKTLPGLRTPVIQKDCTHVYYVYPMTYDAATTGVSRARLVEALRAEGAQVDDRYANIHLLPMYQKRIAQGKNGFPWSFFQSTVSYAKGICPTAEHLNDAEYLGIQLCRYEYNHEETALIVKAFQKVWANLDALKEAPKKQATA